MTITIQTTILGGLPVEVKAQYCPAEPDVGIFSCYFDDHQINFLTGHPVPKTIYARMAERDWDNIDSALGEAVREPF